MHVGVRLPVAMVQQFIAGRGKSKEIQERLARSVFDDERDQVLIGVLFGQMEQLAGRVGKTFGARWYEDRKAHGAFFELVRRLLDHLPAPVADISTLSDNEAAIAPAIIFRQYLDDVKSSEEALSPARQEIMERLAGELEKARIVLDRAERAAAKADEKPAAQSAELKSAAESARRRYQDISDQLASLVTMRPSALQLIKESNQ